MFNELQPKCWPFQDGGAIYLQPNPAKWGVWVFYSKDKPGDELGSLRPIKLILYFLASLYIINSTYSLAQLYKMSNPSDHLTISWSYPLLSVALVEKMTAHSHREKNKASPRHKNNVAITI